LKIAEKMTGNAQMPSGKPISMPSRLAAGRIGLSGCGPGARHPCVMRGVPPCAVLLALSMMSGCSGSSPAPVIQPPGSTVSSGTPVQELETRVPAGLVQLEDDPGLLNAIPDVVASETMADSGLQIAYTRQGQSETVPGALVEAQWVYMQTCLGQVTSPPVVVIRDTPVLPFTAKDDVIFNIDGIPIASASHRDVAIIQVRESDFDGSLGNPGFNLRSIMGRLLWVSAGLAERDYPYGCAREQPS
jgi:hypothetical protein